MIILKSDMKTGQTIMNYAPQLYKRSILHFKRTNSTVKLWFFIYLFNFFLKMFCQGKSVEGERNGMGVGGGNPNIAIVSMKPCLYLPLCWEICDIIRT